MKFDLCVTIVTTLFGQNKLLLNNRAVFTWVLEEIRAFPGFALPHYATGLKNSRKFVIQSIRSKIKINRNLFAHVFLRFVPSTLMYLLWFLIGSLYCLHCLCLVQWKLWFWFLDTQLNTSLEKVLVLHQRRYTIGIHTRHTPFFHPVKSKTKTNCDYLAHIFSRVTSVTCNQFWVLIGSLYSLYPCDWLEWSLWFWFDDTPLKSALI